MDGVVGRRRSRRQTLGQLTALFLSGGLAAACGGAGGGGGPPEGNAGGAATRPEMTIRARHKRPGFDIWERLVADYNARGPATRIALEKNPGGDHHQKIAVEIAGGVAPEVFEMESKRMPSFVNGQLRELTQDFAKSRRAARSVFWPNDWERAYWEGRQYLLPQFDNPAVIYYHGAAFQQRGVPLPPERPTERGWTWDGFLDTARRLTDPGAGTFGFAQSEWWVYLEPWIWSNGGDFLSKDRKALILDAPAALQGIGFAVDLRLKHRVFPSAEEIQAGGTLEAMFSTGTLAMYHHISNWVETVRRHDGLPWNIAPLPRGAVTFKPRSPATMWAMWAEARAPDRAFEVLEHFASEEVHRQIPMLPSRRDVVEAGHFLYATSVPGLRWQVFVETKKAARDDPSTAAFMALDRLLRVEEQRLWRGQLTPREFVAAVKPGVDQALGEAEGAPGT
jgi:multiple sugar transport system substrate-binding protein